jgi:hypothetical protein
MSTTKMGISASRKTVSAFGSCASGIGTAARAGNFAGETGEVRPEDPGASM